MFQGDRVVVDHQHVHFLRVQLSLRHGALPFGFCQCYRYGKGGSLPFLALHLNMTVHQLHDILRDGHAQAGAAVFARGRGVLLGKGVEQVRQEFFAHADTGIPEDHLQGCLAVIAGAFLDQEGNRAAFRCKLHCIAQNVDHHLAQLHAVADIIVVDLSDHPAVEGQALFGALAADHHIHLFQVLGKGEFLVLDHHPA